MVDAGARQLAVRGASLMAPFIAADVGGTHARVGLVRPQSSSRLVLERYEQYVCAEHADLASIMRAFLDGLDGVTVQEAAIACAGYCLDGTIINTNLPWTVSLERMRAELHLSPIEFVNDFEAVAYATPHLQAGDATLLTPHGVAPATAPTVIVGPGTGLGAAVRIPSGHGHVVLATEAGQSAFAPGSEREIEVLRILRRKAAHVSIEQVLSGPGLVNLHAALGELRGSSVQPASPVDIAQAGLRGSDATAREALDMFCGLMGSVLGNLVLLYGAQGGAYLAGGILPQIKDHLVASDFLERFVAKGAMRPVLERVPVWLVEHRQLGVLGAASWYLQQRADAAVGQ
jgi:glucokinase